MPDSVRRRKKKKRKKRRVGGDSTLLLFFFFFLSLDLPLPPRATENEVAGYSRTNFNRAKSS